MKRLVYYFTISFFLVSCKNTAITDLNSSFLNQVELNETNVVQKRISADVSRILTKKFSDAESSERSKKGYTLSDAIKFKNFINKDSLFKVNKVEVNKYSKNKIYSEKKYGLKYSFIFHNCSSEIIEKINFKTVISYRFKNKTINYTGDFSRNKTLKPNDTIMVKGYYVFNYQPVFNAAYFKIHHPEKIKLKINGHATNKVGFSNYSKAELLLSN